AVYLLLHDVVVLPALFLAVAFVDRRYGRGAPGGLLGPHPGLAALFLAAGASLAGAPPWSGFFGKLALLDALFAAGRGDLVPVVLVASLLTLAAMIRLFVGLFWGGQDRPAAEPRPMDPATAWPLTSLVALSLALGLAAGPVLALASAAAGGLVDPSAYVAAVLGG
ncbi:MAG TPA: proton-conducting transporter membrane subunit, partial [Thermodesulfobacteriota bacterium]